MRVAETNIRLPFFGSIFGWPHHTRRTSSSRATEPFSNEKFECKGRSYIRQFPPSKCFYGAARLPHREIFRALLVLSFSLSLFGYRQREGIRWTLWSWGSAAAPLLLSCVFAFGSRNKLIVSTILKKGSCESLVVGTNTSLRVGFLVHA